MAFRNKADLLLKYKPDILVIPECELADKIVFDKKYKHKHSLWFGKNKHKGLAVFSFNNYELETLDCYNESFKLIIPVAVKKENFEFILFAIWANNPEDKDGQYVTQVWKALHYYDELISNNNEVVLIGDFNSNTIWDRPKRKGNHSHVVDHLATKNIHSIYHHRYKQIQGKEKHPTFYLYKHEDKPYHLDYCFASSSLLQHLKSIKVGDYVSWKMYSDHVPLIVNFNKKVLEVL